MTSFGRGRGWSSLPNKEQSLRRPGGLALANSVVKDIIDKINACDVHEHVSSQLIQEVVDLLTSSVNKENLKDTCDTLWKQAMLHDSLTIKIAMVFSHNKVAFIEDSNKDIIRFRFLRFLQDNYMSREKDIIEDRKAFANIVLLHAEVYYRMRLSDGNRLQILAEPLVQYLEDLLQENPKENIYFTLIQFLRSGKDLYAACSERLKNLMLTIRQMMVKEDGSQNRAMLLLMIELANNNYEIKDIHLKEFYISNIKHLSFESPFSQEDLKVITKPKTGNNTLDKQLQENDNSQRVVTDGMKNDVPEHSHYSKNPHVPRAIRGSGALNTKKDDNVNTKLNSMKITSPRQNNNKGFWDHDDRFHKDYE